MIDPIQLKNLLFTFGGAASVKAAHVIIPSYQSVSVTITVSLIFLGIYAVTKDHSPENMTKIIIGMIALNVTDLLKMEVKLACGFNAFVILILSLMSVKGNQESAEKKPKSLPGGPFSLSSTQRCRVTIVRGGQTVVAYRRGM